MKRRTHWFSGRIARAGATGSAAQARQTADFPSAAAIMNGSEPGTGGHYGISLVQRELCASARPGEKYAIEGVAGQAGLFNNPARFLVARDWLIAGV